MKAGGRKIYRHKLIIRLLLSAIIIYLAAVNLMRAGQVSWFAVILAAIIVGFVWYSHVELNEYVLSIQLGLQQKVLGWDDIQGVEIFHSWLYLGLACRITYVQKGRRRKYVFSHLDKMDRFTHDIIERAKSAEISTPSAFSE